MNEVKRLSIKEFWEGGYLQELNRQFLHPLGLALEVIIDTEQYGDIQLGGIWDYRDDPEGLIFAKIDLSLTEKVLLEFEEKSKYRLEKLGFVIQPVKEPT